MLTSSVFTTTAQAALRVRWGMVFSLVTILATIAGNMLFIVVLRFGVTGMILTPGCHWTLHLGAGVILVHGMIGRPSPTSDESRCFVRVRFVTDDASRLGASG